MQQPNVSSLTASLHRISQPGRAKENSPPIYRWASVKRHKSRKGRKNITMLTAGFFRPSGAFEISLVVPAINRWAIFGCPSGTENLPQVRPALFADVKSP
jgi:hypothetical protein